MVSDLWVGIGMVEFVLFFISMVFGDDWGETLTAFFGINFIIFLIVMLVWGAIKIVKSLGWI